MRQRRWWALLVLVLLVIARRYCGHDELRVATFNIEDYPKSATQEVGAFTLISSLGASAIAVQEITQPERFATVAKASLGESWRFAYPTPGPNHRIGVLYDSDALKLLSTRVYRETEVRGEGKAAFEARFQPEDGPVLRIIVVHLKAGGDKVHTRLEQLKGLRRVLIEARKSKELIVLLGDFNATSKEDRGGIKMIADAADMEWASEDVECSSYWDRKDGCRGAALDHVLHCGNGEAKARGPCEIDGCKVADRCPIYVEHISDHCPVTVDLEVD